jgi:hypothetical protein
MPGISHKTALRRFPGYLGYLGSGAGFRRSSVAINGLLTSTWCVVFRAVEAVCGKVAQNV